MLKLEFKTVFKLHGSSIVILAIFLPRVHYTILPQSRQLGNPPPIVSNLFPTTGNLLTNIGGLDQPNTHPDQPDNGPSPAVNQNKDYDSAGEEAPPSVANPLSHLWRESSTTVFKNADKLRALTRRNYEQDLPGMRSSLPTVLETMCWANRFEQWKLFFRKV